MTFNLNDLAKTNKNVPDQFCTFLKYCRNLEFTEEPNYIYLRNLLYEAAKEHNIVDLKSKFDWAYQSDSEKTPLYKTP